MGHSVTVADSWVNALPSLAQPVLNGKNRNPWLRLKYLHPLEMALQVCLAVLRPP